MGHIARLQRCLLPHSPKPGFPKTFLEGQTLQFRALPFGLSTAPMEFTIVVKEVKLMAQAKGIRLHQYLDDWLIRSQTKESCSYQTQALLALCQELGWVVNLHKSELDPKQVFDFVGYRYDLNRGVVLPTPQRWQILNDKIHFLLESRSCSVRQFMSLIGLLTATEKQVPLGRLYMRPIQWHLKRNWHIPESLEKNIPIPASLHPHLKWWLQKDNVLLGQPLHPLQHALQLFTDASREGWGAHLGDHTARGFWSLPESKLHINMLVQPFNGSSHRDLVGLNLHAWLLGSRRSNDRDSLTKWQQELRLLKDRQPGLSTKRNGPFLFVGDSQTR